MKQSAKLNFSAPAATTGIRRGFCDICGASGARPYLFRSLIYGVIERWRCDKPEHIPEDAKETRP